jgi:putative methyltransferase (TIGR04325 family)
MYKSPLSLNPGDYPNLFWLKKLLAKGHSSLFDFGGHIGVKYYTYGPHLDLPQDFSWTTYDLPKVIDEGIKYAQQQTNNSHLSFTKEPLDASKSDIFCAFGSLQYIDIDISEFLNSLEKKPKALLITIPATDQKTYYTVNSIGTAFCPYIIRNEKHFVESIQSVGYSLCQTWDIAEKKLEIPYHDSIYSLDHYRGFLFELN